MRYVIFAVFVVGIAALVAWYGFFSSPKSYASASFDECVLAGNPVMESYPRQCTDGAGVTHIEDVTQTWEISYVNASPDIIRNVSLNAGDTVISPLTITGEARGYWFFEASFPVLIVNWNGLIIAEGFATAVLDSEDPNSTWMTEDFVPFTATLEFQAPEQVTPVHRGAVLLLRDNPSALPENDAALEIPILFQ